MLTNTLLLLGSLYLVIHGAAIATTHASRLARSLKISEYALGFIIVAIISILPETFIGVASAFDGIPAFGVGVLFGSNVADLTLIFALAVFLTGRTIKIERKILRNNALYPILLLLPVMLALDGTLSQTDGLILIASGAFFYYAAFKSGSSKTKAPDHSGHPIRHALMLALGMVLLLIGSNFTVSSASNLALMVGVSPVLIGILVVSLGTTLPELFFALKSLRTKDDALAVGDILGTVLADATIVVGVIALVGPFVVPPNLIYVTGLFMVAASVLVFHFMQEGQTLTKRQAVMLVVFWLAFIYAELTAHLPY